MNKEKAAEMSKITLRKTIYYLLKMPVSKFKFKI